MKRRELRLFHILTLQSKLIVLSRLVSPGFSPLHPVFPTFNAAVALQQGLLDRLLIWRITC